MVWPGKPDPVPFLRKVPQTMLSKATDILSNVLYLAASPMANVSDLKRFEYDTEAIAVLRNAGTFPGEQHADLVTLPDGSLGCVGVASDKNVRRKTANLAMALACIMLGAEERGFKMSHPRIPDFVQTLEDFGLLPLAKTWWEARKRPISPDQGPLSQHEQLRRDAASLGTADPKILNDPFMTVLYKPGPGGLKVADKVYCVVCKKGFNDGHLDGRKHAAALATAEDISWNLNWARKYNHLCLGTADKEPPPPTGLALQVAQAQDKGSGSQLQGGYAQGSGGAASSSRGQGDHELRHCLAEICDGVVLSLSRGG